MRAAGEFQDQPPELLHGIDYISPLFCRQLYLRLRYIPYQAEMEQNQDQAARFGQKPAQKIQVGDHAEWRNLSDRRNLGEQAGKRRIPPEREQRPTAETGQLRDEVFPHEFRDLLLRQLHLLSRR